MSPDELPCKRCGNYPAARVAGMDLGPLCAECARLWRIIHRRHGQDASMTMSPKQLSTFKDKFAPIPGDAAQMAARMAAEVVADRLDGAAQVILRSEIAQWVQAAMDAQQMLSNGERW